MLETPTSRAHRIGRKSQRPKDRKRFQQEDRKDRQTREKNKERKKGRKKEAVYVVIPSSNLSLLSSVVLTCRRSSTRKKERARNSSKSGFVCTSTHFPVSSSSSRSLSVRSISSSFFKNTARIIAKKKYKKPQRNPSS